MPPPHRTHEMKAQRSAQHHARTQEELDKLLRQFPRANRQRILDRLRPHLQFEPKDLHKPE